MGGRSAPIVEYSCSLECLYGTWGNIKNLLCVCGVFVLWGLPLNLRYRIKLVSKRSTNEQSLDKHAPISSQAATGTRQ